MSKVYNNKRRKEVKSRFRIGQKVKFEGHEATIKVIDAWSEEEIFLGINVPALPYDFLVIDSKELD